MKQNRQSIPLALQHQFLIHMALSLISLVFAISMWAICSLAAAAPFFIAAVMLGIGAYRLYHIAVQGHYLELKGVVLKAERAALRQRSKALLLEIDGKALRVLLRNRHLALHEGDCVLLYIADTAPVYEWRGIHQLHTYLALMPEKSSEVK